MVYVLSISVLFSAKSSKSEIAGVRFAPIQLMGDAGGWFGISTRSEADKSTERVESEALKG